MVDIINHPGHPEKVSAKKKVSWSPAPRLPHILHPWGGISPISKFHYQKKKKLGHPNCWKGGGLRILELFQKLNFLYASPRGTRGNYLYQG